MSDPNPKRRHFHKDRERYFWESCFIAALTRESASESIAAADIGLAEWQKRFGKDPADQEAPSA